MKKFKSFLIEAEGKGATFTFGRFNPPTTCHAKLVAKLEQSSKGNFVPLIYTSHSSDPKKNPLSYKKKISYLRKFFPKVGVIDTPARTVFEIVTDLHNKGYTDVRMVVGSDRVKEFDMLIKKYNGQKGRHGFYKFKSINIISAGERDPDADDVSGMSASKMRALASDGDFEAFAQGVPSKNKRVAQSLYKDVRTGMGIKEEHVPHYINEDLIMEGVYDQGIFKAVFLMGGPGSGKSTVVERLSLKALGLKLVNTDKAFEVGLKKAGMSLDLRGADFSKVDPIRAKAKKITGTALDLYIGGRLGLIFDTTAAKSSKIENYKKMLDKIGYEYKMIFVNTNLENAQARNQKRARKLPPEIVKGDWEASQKNANIFRKMFKKDFVEITNDDDVKSFEKKAEQLYGRMLTWTSTFPKNKLAQNWREQELLKKKSK